MKLPNLMMSADEITFLRIVAAEYETALCGMELLQAFRAQGESVPAALELLYGAGLIDAKGGDQTAEDEATYQQAIWL